MDIKDLESRVDAQILKPADRRWIRFIESEPESTIFHHPAWLEVLAESYGYQPFIIATFDENNQISAGIPLVEVRSIVTGRRWVSLPFTDYCFPLYSDPAALVQLTIDLALLYETRSIPRIEIRWELPAHPAVQSCSAYYLHILRLNSDPEVVMKGFKRTHRQNIGTAEDRGVHIEWGTAREQVRQFYEMQLETRHRKGLPVQPWKFFELLENKVLANGLGFVLLAFKDKQCLAGGFFMHWQKTLIYKYAASIDEGQEYRPNNLLTWTAMRWACQYGLTAFDLGRTDLENHGLSRFKRGWGADEKPLTYSILGEIPPESKDGRLMSYMETFIQRTPPWVCKVAGEVMYRHFG